MGVIDRLRDWLGPRIVTVAEASIQPSLAYDGALTGDFNLERAAEICRSLCDRNPMARRVIRLDVDYVVGAAVSAQVILPDGQEAKQENLQTELDRWCKVNRVNTRFWQDLCRRLLVDGEIGVKFVPGPGDTMRPVIIATVGMDAKIDGDSGDVVALTKKVGGRDFRYTVINSLTADPEKGDDYILYFRHDAAGADEGRVRGVPELLPLITRLQYEDEVTKLEVNRAKSMLRYFWQVVVNGASQAELEDLQRKYAQAPATGTVRYTNEHTEFKGISPDLAAHETSRVLTDIRTSIAGGAGHPAHFYGDGSDANLATATAMNAPAGKHFLRLQGEFAEVMETVLMTAVERFLPGSSGINTMDLSFDLTLPEMSEVDPSAAASTLVQTTAAVQSLVDSEFITHAAGQRIISNLIEMTSGIELVDEDLPDPMEEDPYTKNPPPKADDEEPQGGA